MKIDQPRIVMQRVHIVKIRRPVTGVVGRYLEEQRKLVALHGADFDRIEVEREICVDQANRRLSRAIVELFDETAETAVIAEIVPIVALLVGGYYAVPAHLLVAGVVGTEKVPPVTNQTFVPDTSVSTDLTSIAVRISQSTGLAQSSNIVHHFILEERALTTSVDDLLGQGTTGARSGVVAGDAAKRTGDAGVIGGVEVVGWRTGGTLREIVEDC